jgi:hypothetical protein
MTFSRSISSQAASIKTGSAYTRRSWRQHRFEHMNLNVRLCDPTSYSLRMQRFANCMFWNNNEYPGFGAAYDLPMEPEAVRFRNGQDQEHVMTKPFMIGPHFRLQEVSDAASAHRGG